MTPHVTTRRRHARPRPTAAMATGLIANLGQRRLACWTVVFAMVLLGCQVAGCRRSGGEPVTAQAGDLAVTARLRPETPRLQDNTLELEIRDAGGQPVADAEVEVLANMPAMGAMPAMRDKAAVANLGEGRYRADVELGMTGTWTLALRIASPAGASEAQYSLTVGTKGLRTVDGAGGARAHGGTAAEMAPQISHYTCSMHPAVHEDGPGKCPICSMDLIPVTRQEVASGEVVVPEGRRQRIGIRTGPVERRRLVRAVRAVGRVTYDEAGLAEVSVKYAGWIERLHANTTGQAVRKGETLFTLYSPELYAAQEELLVALRSQLAARGTAAPERADYLVAASRQRLRLWDLQDWQIDEVARNGKPIRNQPIVSPVSGVVIEKKVVAGAAVEPGMALFRIAALDPIWIEAELPESELRFVAVGQGATVSLPYLRDDQGGVAVPSEGEPAGGNERAAADGNAGSAQRVGKVAFVLPYLDAATRTGRVRIELRNRDLALKPDMFAEVVFAIDGGERLAVPESAVLYAGTRRLVFLDLGDGRLRPQEIQIGAKSGDFLEVVSGLREGDVVVTSGTFLVAAESRLKSATEQWQ